jgi:hypothetical protein
LSACSKHSLFISLTLLPQTTSSRTAVLNFRRLHILLLHTQRLYSYFLHSFETSPDAHLRLPVRLFPLHNSFIHTCLCIMILSTKSSPFLFLSIQMIFSQKDVHIRSTDVHIRSTDVLIRSTDVLIRSTDVLIRSTDAPNSVAQSCTAH